MSKLLVICGPTATGKTALGVSLAKKFNGEIVSADSRQVYIGMDIGTGKDLPDISKIKNKQSLMLRKQKSKLHIKDQKYQTGYYLFDSIPVWMLDVVGPNQEFSVADYVEIAIKTLNNIRRKKKLPIVVGGTGFYIKALVDGIGTLGVPPDWELRKSLQNKAAVELFEMLCRLDSGRAASMNVSDRKNPRRLIRAIEISLRKSNFSLQNQTSHIQLLTSTLFIGLTSSYETLYERVDQRIDSQAKAGAEDEVRKLLAQGYEWNLPAMSAMGYDVWRDYFEKKTSLEDTIQKWKFEEHAYIRRQMTWFKKDSRINWFDIIKERWSFDVEQLVNGWYNRAR